MCAAAEPDLMQTAAMVAAEWTMKNLFYQGFALPFEVAADLYQELDRGEEARDTARLALKQPWWTVAHWCRYAAYTVGGGAAILHRHTWQLLSH
jgi:hypothetical protein